MSRVLPLSEVKATLSEVVDEVVTTHERVTVTRNGRPVAVVLSIADLESVEETIAILSDPSAVEAIKLGRAAVANGDVATLDEMEALGEQFRRRVSDPVVVGDKEPDLPGLYRVGDRCPGEVVAAVAECETLPHP